DRLAGNIVLGKLIHERTSENIGEKFVYRRRQILGISIVRPGLAPENREDFCCFDKRSSAISKPCANRLLKLRMMQRNNTNRFVCRKFRRFPSCRPTSSHMPAPFIPKLLNN